MFTLKKEKSEFNDLTFELKELIKEEKTKLKASRGKHVIEIQKEINEMKNRK